MKQWRLASGFLSMKVMLMVAVGAAAAWNVMGAEILGPYFAGVGTMRMAQRLSDIADAADGGQNEYLSEQRVQWARRSLASASSPQEELQFQSILAQALVNSGQTEEALKTFDALERLAKQLGIYDANRARLLFDRAICGLRLGEQANCLLHHTTESCLFPIQVAGQHQDRRGSQLAVGYLTELLEGQPRDLGARWLLNIAYMTLGEYPDKVPGRWLIRPEKFASEYDIKRFHDVAGNAGLDVNGLSGGSVLEDFDGDGLLDAMSTGIGLREQMVYFHNKGDGTFESWTERAGLLGLVGGLNMVQGDYNNDGYPDVFVLRGAWFGKAGRHPNSLLRNDGQGGFEDVTEAAGILSFHPTQTAAWLDYNNDGWLDIFVGNESSGGESHACELFKNNGDGTFTDVAVEAGVAMPGFVKGVTAGDYNNDGRVDIYVSCLGQLNRLFRNEGLTNGVWRFTNVARSAGVAEPEDSFPTWFFDQDNDGALDLFVAGYRIKSVADIAADYLGLPHHAERGRFYHNNGDGTFSNATAAVRLDRILHAMGANFGDLDNDGWLDFYIGTGNPDLSTLEPNRMFRNAEGKVFQDVTTSGGFGHLQKGHGISFGDVDNDGDQDVHEDMGGAYSGDVYRNALYENPGHGNHWITIQLLGKESNRLAIGARIRVNISTDAGPQSIHRVVGSGGSFGASPLRQEIGLGQAKSVSSVQVFWPRTGRDQTLENLPLDRFIQITEGATHYVELNPPRFHFPMGAAHHRH